MKRNFLLIASAVLLVSLSSCKSELDLDKTLKFSKLSVEEQKQKIEQNGLDFVSKMEGMEETKAFSALTKLTSLTGTQMAYVAPLSNLKSNLSRNDSKSLETFDRQLRVSVATAEDDEMWGEWTWNPTKNDFDYKSVSTKTAVFKFPATENSTTNNGLLTITYAESNVVAPDSDPVQYMPSKITLVLKVDNSTAMKAEFTGTYKADGTPTKVKQTLEIDKYNWTAEMTNNTEEVSASYHFRYGTETLVKWSVGAKGTFTADDIENSDGPQDIIASGAVNFQVMNIAMLGGIKDVDAFFTEMNGLKNTNDRAYADARVAVINKHLIMYGYFVDKNQKFADVEFYVIETASGHDFEPRFILSDDSRVSIQAYVNEGFDDLYDKLEELGAFNK